MIDIQMQNNHKVPSYPPTHHHSLTTVENLKPWSPALSVDFVCEMGFWKLSTIRTKNSILDVL